MCGGCSIDDSSVVSAFSCVIYSGSVGSTSGPTCVSICYFPVCTDGKWVYDSVFDGLGIKSFLSSE